MELENRSRIGIVGGGPAGSFFAYFLLEFASRVGLELEVDIWEPKAFTAEGPKGCNHCGGIVSESLVQLLATEGIVIPPEVVQRGIESYVLHTDLGRVGIAAPHDEKRIAAVHRGGGPRGAEGKYGSFDGFLLEEAKGKGANVIPKRANRFGWDGDRPTIEEREGLTRTYDLLVGATGINTNALKLFEDLGVSYQSPRGAKTYISELHLGSENIKRYLGDSMHVFLVDATGIEFLAIVPKGDYATLVVLGQNVGKETLEKTLSIPEVERCLPPDWRKEQTACFCLPKINVGGARGIWNDRVVMIGDAGVSRLYKDGIGAAYKTAKACASTVIFEGVSKAAFERFYAPECRTLAFDNTLGKLVFKVVTLFRKVRPLRVGMVRMVQDEQTGRGSAMSSVLWDTFTGSAPYREILLRTLRPSFIARLALDSLIGLFQPRLKTKETATDDDRRRTRTSLSGW